MVVVALGLDVDRAGLLAVAVGVQDDVGRRLGDRERDIAQHRAILHVALRPVDDCAAGLHGGFARSTEGPRGLGHGLRRYPLCPVLKPVSRAHRRTAIATVAIAVGAPPGGTDLDVPQPLAARRARGSGRPPPAPRRGLADDVRGVAQAGREEPCGTTSTAVPVDASDSAIAA